MQKFAGWLKSNSALKGTELQDAAQKAGFAACYIALAPFPQVIQMLVEKPDWTQQLGAAFTSDQSAVYQSVQRLRAAAMALGNLKTTPQQEVVTETASTGQTVILVQPANPQVVYVPVYNTQVVYVQQAPPPFVERRRRGGRRIHGGRHHREFLQQLLLRACTPGAAVLRRTTRRTSGGKTTWTIARTTRRTAGTTPRTTRGSARTRRRTTSRSANRPGKPISRHGSPLRSEPVVTAIHRADEPIDPTVHRQHRERWKRRDGAGESGQPAILRAGESVQPAVHGAGESV